jgi:hypothetical protein
MRAILPNNGWNICYIIISIQYFHHTLGSTVGTYWLLGKASIILEHSGNTRFELQIGDVPHGQEDLVYLYGLLFEVQNYPRFCKVCLLMMRSYIGGCPPGSYSMIYIYG